MILCGMCALASDDLFRAAMGNLCSSVNCALEEQFEKPSP